MARYTKLAAALGVAAVLGGCDFSEDMLWPSLFGEEPEPPLAQPEAVTAPVAEPSLPGAAAQAQPPAAARVVPRPLATAQAAPQPTGSLQPTPGAPQAVPLGIRPGAAAPATGTYVGSKVASLRAELQSLRAQLASQNAEFQQLLNSTTQNSQRYHAVIAAISARLQVGTTPGNPVLTSQWQSAQSELDRVVQDSSRLNELANRISSNSALASYLVEATRAAYGIQGAVDEDHRQLSILEDEVNRTMVSIERLLNEVNETVTRQNSYATGERRNLAAIALAISNGEAFGPNLANFAYSPSVQLARANAPLASVGPRGPTPALAQAGLRPPLVVIRFDRPDVDYQRPLYNAVSEALDRRPSALFDVVAVTPNRGGPSQVAANSGAAKRNAQKVLKSLLAMGLPPERVNISSATSDAALSNEVHLYIR